MAGKSDITLNIGFDLDKSSLRDVKKQMQDLQKANIPDYMAKTGKNAADAAADIGQIASKAQIVQQALQKAYNPKIDSINIATFNQSLAATGTSLDQIYANFSKLGAQGQNAFNNIAGSMMNVTRQQKSVSQTFQKFSDSLTKAINFQVTQKVMNTMIGSVQQAYGYVKSLDRSLNDIQIVTQKSDTSILNFAKNATKVAKQLKTGTTDYTNAAKTFYQQGLSDKEVAARAKTTLKVSNVTGLDSADAADYVTAIANGYQVGADQIEAAMDKVAAVASATASNLSQLSEGMSKVASTANTMGVSEDQLAATLATVVSVTRQSASTVGTAFKTIYARMSDIKAGSQESQISLGNYTSKMAKMGFSVLDASGNMKDLGGVMEQIGGSWKTLTRQQQISLAQTMAGTRQYNNLIALFDNWDQYTRSLNVSMKANGTLQRQQDTYAKSTAAHLQSLETAKQDLFDSLLSADSINTVADLFTGLVDGATSWVDALGGGLGVLQQIGSILLQITSGKIASSVNNMVTNIQGMFSNRQNAQAQRMAIDGISNKADARIVSAWKSMNSRGNSMSMQQQKMSQQIMDNYIAKINNSNTARQDYMRAYYNTNATPDNDYASYLSAMENVRNGKGSQQRSNGQTYQQYVDQQHTNADATSTSSLNAEQVDARQQMLRAAEQEQAAAQSTQAFASQQRQAQIIEGWTQVGAGIMSAVAAMSAFEQAAQVAGDASLSASEKAEKQFNLMATGAVQSITAMTTMATGLQKVFTNLSGGWAMVAVAGIAAVVYGLKSLIASIAQSQFKASLQGQLESQKTKVNELTSAYNDLKSAIESIGSDLSNYDDLVNQLKYLKKGTKQYNDLVLKINRAALKIQRETGVVLDKTGDYYQISQSERDAANQRLESSQRLMSTSAYLESATLQQKQGQADISNIIKTHAKNNSLNSDDVTREFYGNYLADPQNYIENFKAQMSSNFKQNYKQLGSDYTDLFDTLLSYATDAKQLSTILNSNDRQSFIQTFGKDLGQQIFDLIFGTGNDQLNFGLAGNVGNVFNGGYAEDFSSQTQFIRFMASYAPEDFDAITQSATNTKQTASSTRQAAGQVLISQFLTDTTEDRYLGLNTSQQAIIENDALTLFTTAYENASSQYDEKIASDKVGSDLTNLLTQNGYAKTASYDAQTKTYTVDGQTYTSASGVKSAVISKQAAQGIKGDLNVEDLISTQQSIMNAADLLIPNSKEIVKRNKLIAAANGLQSGHMEAVQQYLKTYQGGWEDITALIKNSGINLNGAMNLNISYVKDQIKANSAGYTFDSFYASRQATMNAYSQDSTAIDTALSEYYKKGQISQQTRNELKVIIDDYDTLVEGSEQWTQTLIDQKKAIQSQKKQAKILMQQQLQAYEQLKAEGGELTAAQQQHYAALKAAAGQDGNFFSDSYDNIKSDIENITSLMSSRRTDEKKLSNKNQMSETDMLAAVGMGYNPSDFTYNAQTGIFTLGEQGKAGYGDFITARYSKSMQAQVDALNSDIQQRMLAIAVQNNYDEDKTRQAVASDQQLQYLINQSRMLQMMINTRYDAFARTAEQWSTMATTVKQLKSGGTIQKQTYLQLSDDDKKLFLQQSDGSYKYYGNQQQAQAMAAKLEQEASLAALAELGQQQTTVDTVDTISSTTNSILDGVMQIVAQISGKDIESQQELLRSMGYSQEFIAAATKEAEKDASTQSTGSGGEGDPADSIQMNAANTQQAAATLMMTAAATLSGKMEKYEQLANYTGQNVNDLLLAYSPGQIDEMCQQMQIERQTLINYYGGQGNMSNDEQQLAYYGGQQEVQDRQKNLQLVQTYLGGDYLSDDRFTNSNAILQSSVNQVLDERAALVEPLEKFFGDMFDYNALSKNGLNNIKASKERRLKQVGIYVGNTEGINTISDLKAREAQIAQIRNGYFSTMSNNDAHFNIEDFNDISNANLELISQITSARNGIDVSQLIGKSTDQLSVINDILNATGLSFQNIKDFDNLPDLLKLINNLIKSGVDPEKLKNVTNLTQFGIGSDGSLLGGGKYSSIIAWNDFQSQREDEYEKLSPALKEKYSKKDAVYMSDQQWQTVTQQSNGKVKFHELEQQLLNKKNSVQTAIADGLSGTMTVSEFREATRSTDNKASLDSIQTFYSKYVNDANGTNHSGVQFNDSFFLDPFKISPQFIDTANQSEVDAAIESVRQALISQLKDWGVAITDELKDMDILSLQEIVDAVYEDKKSGTLDIVSKWDSSVSMENRSFNNTGYTGFELDSDMTASIMGSISEARKNLSGKSAEEISEIAQGLAKNFNNTFSESLGCDIPVSVFENMLNASEADIQTLFQYLGSMGGQGFTIGLDSSGGIVSAAANNIGQIAFNVLCSFLGVASPSKLFKYVGEMCVQGFSIGLNGMDAALTSSFQSILDASQKIIDNIGNLFDDEKVNVLNARNFLKQIGLDPDKMIKDEKGNDISVFNSFSAALTNGKTDDWLSTYGYGVNEQGGIYAGTQNPFDNIPNNREAIASFMESLGFNKYEINNDSIDTMWNAIQQGTISEYLTGFGVTYDDKTGYAYRNGTLITQKKKLASYSDWQKTVAGMSSEDLQTLYQGGTVTQGNTQWSLGDMSQDDKAIVKAYAISKTPNKVQAISAAQSFMEENPNNVVAKGIFDEQLYQANFGISGFQFSAAQNAVWQEMRKINGIQQEAMDDYTGTVIAATVAQLDFNKAVDTYTSNTSSYVTTLKSKTASDFDKSMARAGMATELGTLFGNDAWGTDAGLQMLTDNPKVLQAAIALAQGTATQAQFNELEVANTKIGWTKLGVKVERADLDKLINDIAALKDGATVNLAVKHDEGWADKLNEEVQQVMYDATVDALLDGATSEEASAIGVNAGKQFLKVSRVDWDKTYQKGMQEYTNLVANTTQTALEPLSTIEGLEKQYIKNQTATIDLLDKAVEAQYITEEQKNAFTHQMDETGHGGEASTEVANGIQDGLGAVLQSGNLFQTDEIPLDSTLDVTSNTEVVNGGTVTIKGKFKGVKIKEGILSKLASPDNNTKKGGGGGGGKPKKVQKTKNDMDPYHDVQIAIDKLTKSMQRLNKQQDKLTGKNRLQSLYEETKMLKQQVSLYGTKFKIASAVLKTRQDELKAAANAIGAEAKFDATTGQLLNYYELKVRATANANAIEDQINAAASSTGKQSKADKKASEEAQQKLSEIKQQNSDLNDAIQKYEQTLNTVMQQLITSIQDMASQIVETQIEMFKYPLELATSVNDLRKSWNEFDTSLTSTLSSNLHEAENTVKNITSYLTADASGKSIFSRLKTQLKDTLSEIKKGVNGIFGTDVTKQIVASGLNQKSLPKTVQDELKKNLKFIDEATAYDTLKEYQEQAQTMLTEMVEGLSTMKQAVQTALEGVGTAFTRQLDIIKYQINEFKHQVKMVQNLNGKYSYADQNGSLDQQYQLSKQQTQVGITQLTYWQNMLSTIDAERAKAQKKLKSYKGNNETIRAQYENELRYQQQLYDATAQKLQQAQNTLNTSIEQTYTNLLQLYKNGVNQLTNDFERALTGDMLSSFLKDEISIIQKNQKAYYDAIQRDTKTKDLQSQWLKSIDEAALLSTQRKLTSIMEEQMEMLQRKDELSERDLKYATQKYKLAVAEAKLQEARNNKSSIKLRRDSQGNYSYSYTANQSDIIAAEDEANKARGQLWEIAKSNLQDSQNTLASAAGQIASQINKILTDNPSDGETARKEITNLLEHQRSYLQSQYEQNATAIAQARDAFSVYYGRQASDEELDRILDGALSSQTQIAAFLANPTQAIDKLLAGSTQITQMFGQELAELMLSESVAEKTYYSNVQKLSDNVEKLVDNATEEADQAMTLMKTYVDQFNSVIKQIASMKDLIDKAMTTFESQLKGIDEYVKKLKNGQDTGKTSTTTSTDSTVAAIKTSNQWLKAIASGIDYVVKYYGGKGVTGAPSSFDTGGYTGEWGKEGKIATLHEKQIVLNKTDTANLLDAVELIRDNPVQMMLKSIQAPQMSTVTIGNDTVDQKVSIEASFPNVKDSSEIQNALNNLVNIAAQRAFRR